jgi:hypothetical protein
MRDFTQVIGDEMKATISVDLPRIILIRGLSLFKSKKLENKRRRTKIT